MNNLYFPFVLFQSFLNVVFYYSGLKQSLILETKPNCFLQIYFFHGVLMSILKVTFTTKCLSSEAQFKFFFYFVEKSRSQYIHDLSNL